MDNTTSSHSPRDSAAAPTVFFARHPVFRLVDWAAAAGEDGVARAHERARHHVSAGRLLRVGRDLYAAVPPGVDPDRFSPDPYLVAAAIRPDALLSHHTALDLHGVAHSVFRRYAFFTAGARTTLQFRGAEWKPLRHPAPLVASRRTDFGVVRLDRDGAILRVTSPERTLIDGFAAPAWSGGLEEHVNSCEGFRDLDLDLVWSYLALLDRALLFSAVGWFVESRAGVAEASSKFLARVERRALVRSHYLGGRRPGGAFVRRWKLILPSTLRPAFEGRPPEEVV
jgi:predicted transcriptional regulator of viral defense system